MRRVSVVGSTGSGKTAFARALTASLGVSPIELDAIRHQPNWVDLPDHLFRERVDGATRGDAWVVDGNYGQFVRDTVWSRADTVVWLDYGFGRVLWQLFRRTVRRAWTREELWNGNRESFRIAFASHDSLLGPRA